MTQIGKISGRTGNKVVDRKRWGVGGGCHVNEKDLVRVGSMEIGVLCILYICDFIY